MKQTILGAIAGDVIGSVYEFNNTRTTDFPLFKRETTFTDDTVMTIAIADAILHNKDFAQTILDYGKCYPNRGYGTSFFKWLAHDTLAPPYNSWGNGSAMRVSAVGFAYNDLGIVLDKAAQTAEVTHNHPEGIKGAQAIAVAVYLARIGKSKAAIKAYMTEMFEYDLDFTLDEIRPTFPFDESCQGTVPQSIVAFLERKKGSELNNPYILFIPTEIIANKNFHITRNGNYFSSFRIPKDKCSEMLQYYSALKDMGMLGR